MTTDEQQFAIAESQGYSAEPYHNPTYPKTKLYALKWRGTIVNTGHGHLTLKQLICLGYYRDGNVIPDYLNDWNAIHEMVADLKGTQRRMFCRWLKENVECAESFEYAIASTKAQWCEAYLRAVNRWV